MILPRPGQESNSVRHMYIYVRPGTMIQCFIAYGTIFGSRNGFESREREDVGPREPSQISEWPHAQYVIASWGVHVCYGKPMDPPGIHVFK